MTKPKNRLWSMEQITSQLGVQKADRKGKPLSLIVNRQTPFPVFVVVHLTKKQAAVLIEKLTKALKS